MQAGGSRTIGRDENGGRGGQSGSEAVEAPVKSLSVSFLHSSDDGSIHSLSTAIRAHACEN